MKKTLGIVVLLAMALGMVGCDDYVTPKGVVETAAYSLLKNDVKAYQKALTGDALAQYGTKAGMTELSAKLRGQHGLRVESAQLVSETPVRNNGFQVAVRKYSVGVLVQSGAKDIRILNATVLCDIFTMEGCIGSRSNSCYYSSQDELTECKVSELK